MSNSAQLQIDTEQKDKLSTALNETKTDKLVYLCVSLSPYSALILPTSLTEEVLEVVDSSNTGVTGQWLFRVDQAQVLLPSEFSSCLDSRVEPQNPGS